MTRQLKLAGFAALGMALGSTASLLPTPTGLLDFSMGTRAEARRSPPPPVWRCPRCGAHMHPHGAGGHMGHHANEDRAAADRAACQQSRNNANATAARLRAEADKKALETKQFVPAARLAALSSVPGAMKAAESAQASAAAARAAAKGAADQLGQRCAQAGEINPHANPAAAAATAAEADANSAREAALAAEEVAKTLPIHEKYASDLKPVVEGLNKHADMLKARAPLALEAVGGFVGKAKQKFLKAVTTLKSLAQQSFELFDSAGALRTESLTPKDEAALDHVIKIRKTLELGRQELDLPVDTEKEVDKELDNFSLKELGVKGDGEEPEKDEKNLEHAYDKAKEALAELSRKGARYLKVAADALNAKHAAVGKPMQDKFIGWTKDMKGALKAVIESITDIQKQQSGDATPEERDLISATEDKKEDAAEAEMTGGKAAPTAVAAAEAPAAEAPAAEAPAAEAPAAEAPAAEAPAPAAEAPAAEAPAAEAPAAEAPAAEAPAAEAPAAEAPAAEAPAAKAEESTGEEAAKPAAETSDGTVTWKRVSGSLKQVSVGGANHVWGVNAQRKAFRWSGSAWTAVPGKLKSVSVGADGVVWGVDSTGKAVRRDGTRWKAFAGGLRRIAVGGAEHVWALSSKGRVFHYTEGKWQRLDTGYAQVAVGSDGAVWAVTKQGNVVRRDGDQWAKVPGTLRKIAVGDANQVWGISTDGHVVQWTGSEWKTTEAEMKSIAVAADGSLWAVNESGHVFRANAPASAAKPASAAEKEAAEVEAAAGDAPEEKKAEAEEAQSEGN